MPTKLMHGLIVPVSSSGKSSLVYNNRASNLTNYLCLQFGSVEERGGLVTD